MVDVRIRTAEGCDPQPFLLWDTVWSNGDAQNDAGGDWALAGPNETLNQGGLRAVAALETGVTLCLFSDKRCPPNHPLAKYAGDDPRGYWGDGIDVRTDLGEAELGSLLWLLERAAVTPETRRWAIAFAEDALAPLIVQGACARVAADATILPGRNGYFLDVALYGRDGSKIYDRRFEVVWAQIGPR